MTDSTALTPREALKSTLAGFLPSYGNLLPQGYDPQRLVTGALVSVQRNPDLLKCDPMSVATALAMIAQWGLDLGTTAHLVPFGKSCTPVADYKGFIELMVAAGARKVEAHEVRHGDDFSYQYGTDAWLRHTPKAPKDAPIVAAYAVVTLRGGAEQFEVMPVDDIEDIRHKSKNWSNGPLPAWYARKTVIRRAAKYVPKTPRLSAVLAGDELEATPEAVTPEILAALEPKRIVGPTPIRESGATPYDPETGEVTPKAQTNEDRRPLRSPPGNRNMAGTIMPGAPSKWDGNGGKPLTEVPTSVLTAFIGWVEKQTEPSDNLLLCVINAKNIILDRENRGDPAPAEDAFDTVPAGLRAQDDDLPFRSER